MATPPPSKDPMHKSIRKSIKKGLKNIREHLQRPTSDAGDQVSLLPGVLTGPATLPPSAPTIAGINPTRYLVGGDTGGLVGAQVLAPDATLTDTAISVNTGPVAKLATGLASALRALHIGADLVPPLKPAIGELLACLDVLEAATNSAQEYSELTKELEIVARVLKEYFEQLGPGDYAGNAACERIARSIEAEVAHIKKQQGRSQKRAALEAVYDQDDVIKHYRRVEGLFRQLQGNISLQTLKKTNKQYTNALLQNMSPTQDALYNSGYSTTIMRRGCTPETRQKVQADLQAWVQDPEGAKVYWMNGMAGTGKTTIAYSLCEWLEENQRLGGSFFCSRVSSACRNVSSIIPTLAYQLAWYSPAFRLALCDVLENDPSDSKRNVAKQFEKLVQGPMLTARDAMPGGVVVVVDALDECEDDYGVRLILEVLLRLGANLPIRFFVTSRPEPAVWEKMLSLDRYSPTVLHLHDIERSIVEDDIKKYLTEIFEPMSPPPSYEQIEQLAILSGKLFIYAATVARYIMPGQGGVNSAARLNTLLTAGKKGSGKKYERLDELYTVVLAASFNDKILEEEEAEVMRLVLWSVVCAKEPMTVSTLASLLSLTEQDVALALQPLRSVLHVSEPEGLVSTLHASFPDYMLDRYRSKVFHCDENRQNGFLAKQCFEAMKEGLRFNICNLESSFILDKDVPHLQQRIKDNISPTLFYACRFWGEHLRLTGTSEPLGIHITEFLNQKLLFWMEILNLKQCLAEGALVLSHVEGWLTSFNHSKEVIDYAADARDFVVRFAAGACVQSTPHIYVSALPFCGRSSSVYRDYWGRMHHLMRAKGTTMNQRDQSAQVTWMTKVNPLTVAFSPDGTQIFAGFSDCTAQMWDAHTGDIVAGPFQGDTAPNVSHVSRFAFRGKRMAYASHDIAIHVWDARTGEVVAGPFRGHTESIHSLDFSPDGTHIASGSSDCTIRVWDTRNGAMAAEPLVLTGHDGAAMAVAFSPSGMHIASGSSDHTVRVWDSSTGVSTIGPFQGHTSLVGSVAFSPNGTYVVSGSMDKTIRVWEVFTGAVIAGPFQGHTESVNSVAFSPTGLQIVSGSNDRSIIVWDTYTGRIVASPFLGHTNIIHSVAFSPDGTRIVSGAHDDTVRVWDARHGTTVNAEPQTHTTWVDCIAFSPNNLHIASGSFDRTIRVWDAHTGDNIAGPFRGHGGWVTAIAFSSDGARIVSGSWGRSVQVYDVRAGVRIAGPFLGHTDMITSVNFSPDGTRIVSSSNDRTVLVWDANTGTVVFGPFERHTGAVSSVMFSPDSKWVVSGSDDSTILVWDASSGDIISGPLPGCTESIQSVAFSPNGTRITSNSDESSIQVWDAYTGNILVGPFRGHTDSVVSVAFSPDGTRIISSSADNTILVWNACSGDIVLGPLQGHTNTVLAVACSSNGTCIASCSRDTTIRTWDVRTGSLATGPLHGHTLSSGPPVLSPDQTQTQPGAHNQIIRSPVSDASARHADPEHPVESPRTISPLGMEFSAAPPTTTPGVRDPVDERIISQILACNRNFQANEDGWVVSDGLLLFWVSPDLRDYVPHPRTKVVIGTQGTLSIDYGDIVLGERWSECYPSQ